MDDDVTAAVRAFRAATKTTRDDAGRRAVWRSLQAQTAEPRRPTVLVVVAALAIAAALVVAFGRIGDDVDRRAAAAKHDQAIDAAERAVPRNTTQAMPPAELDADALPRAVSPREVARVEPPPVQRPRTTRPLEEPTTEATGELHVVPDSDRLEREAALLRRAREAALAGDRATATAALDAHVREFPTGVLAPERWTLRVELACAAGNPDDARRAAAAFAAAHPHLPTAKRLRDRPCD